MKYGLISHAMHNRKMYSERGRYVINIYCKSTKYNENLMLTNLTNKKKTLN